MKNFLFKLTLTGLLVLVKAAHGAANDEIKLIEETLTKAIPGIQFESIKPAPIKGLYEVMAGPKIFYMSADGQYLFQGSLIDVKAKTDLTESRLATARVHALDRVGADKMIIFKPKIQKHLAYVFTDIDCGYCRKLHSEIDQYMAEGIEIRYLFFPRAGEGSDSWNKAVSVWCSDDRNAALTKAKKGEKLAGKSCDNPVLEHMNLGVAMGANGTPMIVTQKGQILPGYVNASQLAKLLEQEEKSAMH